jgi:hypothetical protein
MDQLGTGRAKPVRRHLLKAETLARGALVGQVPDLTRRHGQSNGIRIHAVIFGAVSLATLLLLIIAAVVITNPMS